MSVERESRFHLYVSQCFALYLFLKFGGTAHWILYKPLKGYPYTRTVMPKTDFTVFLCQIETAQNSSSSLCISHVTLKYSFFAVDGFRWRFPEGNTRYTVSTSHRGLFADYPRVPLLTNLLFLEASRGPLPGGALQHRTVSFSSPTRVPLSGKARGWR